tara:strand:+ start:546 stop:1124 length:579 start_codon:yes stop_codon:yes gene_type:complete
LGVARAEGDGQWQFVGVLPLFDPPREDAKATIATALAMGVKVKMVTGDALAIAQETAKKLVLGVIGVVSTFGLFYLGERVFHLDRGHIQTLMYLKLSVAGHLAIFLTRTRGQFWSIRPAKILWIAVLGTQIVATLIAVYGLFMTPLGWGWAGFVWGYVLLWFLMNDRVKLLAYRILDPAKAEREIRKDGPPK